MENQPTSLLGTRKLKFDFPLTSEGTPPKKISLDPFDPTDTSINKDRFVKPAPWEEVFRFIGIDGMGSGVHAKDHVSLYFVNLDLLPPHNSLIKLPKGKGHEYHSDFPIPGAHQRTDLLKVSNRDFEVAIGGLHMSDHWGPLSFRRTVFDLNVKVRF